MKNYQIVVRELMVVERAAWWNPRLRAHSQGGTVSRYVFAPAQPYDACGVQLQSHAGSYRR
jgi:hypothetical protein